MEMVVLDDDTAEEKYFLAKYKSNRVPDDIKTLGHEMIKVYIDARIKKIEGLNEKLFEAIKQETYDLREATRGSGVVVCHKCADEVHWGALMYHRTRTCRV